MNKGYGLWPVLLAFFWMLPGVCVRAEETERLLLMQLNEAEVSLDKETIWLSADQISASERKVNLCFWGEGEQDLLLYEKGEEDVYEKREFVFRPVTEEEFFLATGKSAEGLELWAAEYCFELEEEAYFFGINNQEDQEEVMGLPVIRVDEMLPTLFVELPKETGEHGFYVEDIEVFLKAEDSVSGIYEASFWADGEVVKEWKMEDEKFLLEESVKLQAKDWEGTVPICFSVRDQAGNLTQYETVIKIDGRPPEMELEWKAGHAANGMYYAKERRACLRIWETHFDADEIQVYNGDQKLAGNKFIKVPGKECYETELVFSEDGAYEIWVTGKDFAGNKGAERTVSRFIIDRTPPTVLIRYEDGAERKEAFSKVRKAQIAIKETNPDFNGVELWMSKNGEERKLQPGDVGFSLTEDGINGKLYFEEEGEYTWRLQVTDLAGNISVCWESEPFLLDFAKPELKLNGVEEDDSVNDAVQLSVIGEDAWFLEDSLEMAIYRDGRKVEVDTECFDIENGQKISLAEFPADKSWDGHYIIEARCEDTAGNETEEQWSFTVNRFGSSFVLGGELQKAMKSYYTNMVPVINLTEINADALLEQRLYLTDEGGMHLLTLGEDYAVTHQEDAEGWHTYLYRIYESAFRKDGVCVLSLYSKDDAGNMLESQLHTPIEFFLDRQGPMIHIMQAAGAVGLSPYTELRVSGKSPVRELIFRLNGEEISSYTEQEILEAEGVFRLYLQDMKLPGTLAAEAEDAAGNQTFREWNVLKEPEKELTVSGEIAESTGEKSSETEKTTDFPWIIIWIFVACFILCTLIVHFVKKQNKNKDDSC